MIVGSWKCVEAILDQEIEPFEEGDGMELMLTAEGNGTMIDNGVMDLIKWKLDKGNAVLKVLLDDDVLEFRIDSLDESSLVLGTDAAPITMRFARL